MIRQQKLAFIIVACIVVALISGIVPLNYVHKFSHGCPISDKAKAKTSTCFHDAVTSSFPDFNVIAGPPVFAPTGPEGASVRAAQALDLWGFAENTPVEGSPLRC